jgi:hypothetical protein
VDTPSATDVAHANYTECSNMVRGQRVEVHLQRYDDILYAFRLVKKSLLIASMSDYLHNVHHLSLQGNM